MSNPDGESVELCRTKDSSRVRCHNRQHPASSSAARKKVFVVVSFLALEGDTLSDGTLRRENTRLPYKDKNKQRDYQREYKRNKRRGSATPGSIDLPVSFRLRTAQDLVDLIEQQIAAVQGDPTARTLDKARCVASLISVALRTLDQRDLTLRVEALEAILKQPERFGPKAA